ncbi:hypothetical protein QBZ16_000594 [Prototheca wickerhamii]|uniref:Uncharacterized protein n=1 Tax=Prototheca wickerhamii TaxID=3111 RepID=A0AAD9INF2_PROWI|nr:hypothetical protein QBZ16_000594 [Prototheca wickerhamii]
MFNRDRIKALADQARAAGGRLASQARDGIAQAQHNFAPPKQSSDQSELSHEEQVQLLSVQNEALRDRLKSLLRVSEENEHLRSVLEQVGVQDGGPAPAPAADDGRADALQEELRSARQELSSATEARYALEKELVKTQEALKAARSERVSLRELQEATALAASQAAALQAENERLQARLRAPAEVSGENGRLAQELASAGRRVAALEAALEETHHLSTALQAELDGSEREAGRLEAQLREAEEAASLAEAKLRELDGDEAREQAAWLQQKLESAHEQVAQLQARDRELERSLRDAWPTVSELDRIVLALTRELEQRRAGQEAAARETALLRSELDGLREQAADTERQRCNELDAKLQSAAQETAAAMEEAQRQQARAESLSRELTDLQQRHETEVAALQHAHGQDLASEHRGADVLDLRDSDTSADEDTLAGAATLKTSLEEAHLGSGAVPPEADDRAAVARASVEADLMALRLRFSPDEHARVKKKALEQPTSFWALP